MPPEATLRGVEVLAGLVGRCICVQWAGAGTHHAGCLILVGIDHGEFGTVLRVIEAAFAARPNPEDWRDYTAWGTRGSGD